MLSTLHFHIIYSSLVVVQVYVEPDTFSVIERIDGFLCGRHGNLTPRKRRDAVIGCSKRIFHDGADV